MGPFQCFNRNNILDAKIVGTISITFDTTVQPISSRIKQDMHESARSHFMALLTGVVSTLGGKDSHMTCGSS